MERTLSVPNLGTAHTLDVHGDVVHEVLPVGVVEHFLPQCAGLFEID